MFNVTYVSRSHAHSYWKDVSMCENKTQPSFLKIDIMRHHLQLPMSQVTWTYFLSMLLDRPDLNEIKGRIKCAQNCLKAFQIFKGFFFN